MTWGKKEDHLYIDLNRSPVTTLGHGQLMRRYGPADLARDELFAQADAYFDLGGVELMAGALPVPRVVGGLAFIKPLGFIDQTQARSLSIGVTYAADLNAPDVLDTAPNFADGRPQFLVADDDRLERANRTDLFGHVVQGFGVDAELKLLKNQNVDIKTYLDWTALAFPAGSALGGGFVSSGYTAGALFRMNFGQEMLVDGHAVWEMPSRDEDRVDESDIELPEVTFVPEHALRLRVEARAFEGGFRPSYFDSFYEHERLQMSGQNTLLAARHQLPTRWASLAASKDDPWRAGGYLEASYLSPGNLGVTVAYEDAFDMRGARVTDASNLSLHVETHQLDGFQFFASYHYRRFDDLTNFLRFNSNSELVYLGASLRPFPIMNISFVTQRSFRVGFGPDDLARQRYVVDGKEDVFRRTTTGLLAGWTSDFRIDLGWHW